MERPNIILIMTDQHALHALSCYGAPVCRTPNIDSLAVDGALFRRAVTPCALCTPARASLLTGLYPHRHGATRNSEHNPLDEDRLGEPLTMYPRRLADAGYRLGYAGKWHAGLARTCADVGFEGVGPRGYGNVWGLPEYEAWLERRGLTKPERVMEFLAEGERRYAAGDGGGYLDGPAEATPDAFLVDTTIDLVDRFAADDNPFFVALNFWGPHAPYLPSREFKDMYPPSVLPPWPSFEDDLAGRPLVHRKYRECVFPNAARAPWDVWAGMVSRYYAQASQIDAQIGRLLDHLKEKGLYDGATIVFCADHGETAGIHGGAFDKGAMAYEEVYRIPLIVKRPAARAGAGGERDQWVSLMDLAPTFCEWAGTEMGETHGRSLTPLLENPSATGRAHIVAEFHGHRFPVAQRVIWWDRFKYVLNFADTDELYDLEADPAEMDNRIADPSLREAREQLRARLVEEMAATGDITGPQYRYILERPLQP